MRAKKKKTNVLRGLDDEVKYMTNNIYENILGLPNKSSSIEKVLKLSILYGSLQIWITKITKKMLKTLLGRDKSI